MTAAVKNVHLAVGLHVQVDGLRGHQGLLEVHPCLVHQRVKDHRTCQPTSRDARLGQTNGTYTVNRECCSVDQSSFDFSKNDQAHYDVELSLLIDTVQIYHIFPCICCTTKSKI